MDATPTAAPDLAETIRDYFRGDRSRMTMMAARKFAVPEQVVVDALVGQWPITPLRPGAFRDLMDALPGLGLMRVFVRSKAAVVTLSDRMGKTRLRLVVDSLGTPSLEFLDETGRVAAVQL